MNIIGPDALVFGVDDVAGLREISHRLWPRSRRCRATGGRFEALDGTAIVVRRRGRPDLPPPLETGTMLRQTVYGVARRGRPRRHRRRTRARPPGPAPRRRRRRGAWTISASRCVSRSRRGVSSTLPGERVNAPGAPAQRPRQSDLASGRTCRRSRARSRTSSVSCPTSPSAEAFYVERLGFKVTDRFGMPGPFLRPAGTQDHHTLFFIQTPRLHEGLRALRLPFGRPDRVAAGGNALRRRRAISRFWGPGRHKFGSNWFWYFNSPLGCHVEYDADMDLHDDEWTPRETPMSPEASQTFLFEYPREMGARAGRRAAAASRRGLSRRRRASVPRRRYRGRRGARLRARRRSRDARSSSCAAAALCTPIWDACPHYGDTPMAWRTDAYLNAARDRIVCASHGAEFEIETGLCVTGAALGQSSDDRRRVRNERRRRPRADRRA